MLGEWPIILLAKGNKIGKSIKEENCEAIIKQIFETLKKHSCKITFPEDVLVGKNLDDNSKVKELTNIEDDDLILDIGPKTINKIKKLLKPVKQFYGMVQQAILKTQILLEGSYEIANAIIRKNKDNSIYSVVGGGDTIALINQINVIQDFNFVSTAGGAFLEYLEGKELPGIKALN